MGFQDAVAGVVDGEQVGVDGVALGVTDATRLLQTDFYR